MGTLPCRGASCDMLCSVETNQIDLLVALRCLFVFRQCNLFPKLGPQLFIRRGIGQKCDHKNMPKGSFIIAAHIFSCPHSYNSRYT